MPSGLLQINKRWVHRALEAMGARTAIRSVPDLQGLAQQVPEVRELLGNLTDQVKRTAAEARVDEGAPSD